jgi:hypothetical protein
VDDVVVSISEAARRLDIDRRTVRDLMRAAGIEPVPHPSNHRAKGVSFTHVRTLRRVLDGIAGAMARSARASA